jgi:integrase
LKGRIEDTIDLLNRGVLEMPPDADPRLFITSGGKLTKKHKVAAHADGKLVDICTGYLADQQGKAPTTLVTEGVHTRHFRRVFGDRTKLRSLSIEDVQKYINKRANEKDKYGTPTSGATIKKELATFIQLWSWAKLRKLVSGECPIYNDRRKWAVSIPKPIEKEKFQTWDEIERRIARGQGKELWDCLFLDNSQVLELLRHVKATKLPLFIYPMFVFAAYTGARRSEICRSQIEDFDFVTGRVKIREKKRSRQQAQTVRFVDLHPRLAEAMKSWFAKHPGGAATIFDPSLMKQRKSQKDVPHMLPKEATKFFKLGLADSKWSVARGLHVLRHSFGSNLLRAGVQRDRIADWMGHTTDDMMRLYQHLFPQDGASQIKAIA